MDVDIIPHLRPMALINTSINRVRREYGEQLEFPTSPFSPPWISPCTSRDVVPFPRRRKCTSLRRWAGQLPCCSLPRGMGELPSWHTGSPKVNLHRKGRKQSSNILTMRKFFLKFSSVLLQKQWPSQRAENPKSVHLSPSACSSYALLARGHLIHSSASKDWWLPQWAQECCPLLSPLSKVSWRSWEFTWLDITCLPMPAGLQL